MKKFVCTSILAVLIASMTAVSAGNYPEEYLGLPGDNLNLYAVMKLFQESETLEAFERDLNDEKSKINNLDLNGDNLVDYITVTDYVDGNVHTIALRTALNQKESQDVAVFTVQQFKDGSVQIQLVGDELLYGKNYIVEPIYAETPNPGYKGTTVYSDNVKVVTTTYYEVAAWPVIRFIYDPFYVSWNSSWYWGYYPVYWNPWRPYYWHYYYGYHYNWYHDYYSHYYHHCDYYRYHYYDDHYYNSNRHYSSEVAHRVSAGNYSYTYSRPEQRKEGEAMYARTQAGRSADTRRQPSVQSTNSGQRSSAEVSQRSAADATRRSSTSGSASVQKSELARQSSVQRSQSSASREQSSVQRSQPSASRQQSSVQKSQSPASREQSSVQRSQPSASRQQSSVHKSQPSASRQQASVQRSQPSASRQQSSVQRSQSSRPSAPEARSSGHSSSQSRSSAPSQRAGSSQNRSNAGSQRSSSSRGSDNDRSSPR